MPKRPAAEEPCRQLEKRFRPGFLLGCDARLKLCLALAGWASVLAAARPAGPLWIAGCALASLLGSGIRLRRVLHPLGAGLFTALVAVVLRVVLTRGEPAYRVHLGTYELAIAASGLHEATRLAARILGAVAVGSWLSATTAWLELERALAWLRLPAPLLEILTLAQRYVSVLRECVDTARGAQELRLGYRDLRRSLSSAGVLAGLLLGRALDQADATAQAMQLRGYRSERRPAAWQSPSRGNRRLAVFSLSVLAGSALLSGGLPW
jgi:cobalt/nickel transport system permease protein